MTPPPRPPGFLRARTWALILTIALALGLAIFWMARAPSTEALAAPIADAAPSATSAHRPHARPASPIEADAHDGRLVYQVTAGERPLAGARVELIPVDEGHQARAPACACPIAPEEPTDDAANQPPGLLAEPEEVSALDNPCGDCVASQEALMGLARRGVGALAEQEILTDGEGIARFTGLSRTATYDVWIEAKGYAPGREIDQKADDASGEETVHDVALEAPVTLVVHVYDGAGEPLRTAEVAAFVASPFHVFFGTRQGNDLRLEGLPHDTFTLLASAPGYVAAAQELSDDDATGTPLEIDLTRPISVSGRVHHGDAPLAGAKVVLSGHRSLRAMTTSDAQGKFSFPSMVPGSYRLEGTYAALRGELDVELRAEWGTPLDLDLTAYAQLEGKTLEAADGQPLPDVVVKVDDGASQFLSARSDASGHFQLELPPGAYDLEARVPNHVVFTRELTVTEGQPQKIELRFERGETLTGRVVDASGQPVPGTSIWLTSGQGEGPSTRTGADGTFELSGLAPEPLSLSAKASGHPLLEQAVTLPSGPLSLVLVDGATLEGLVLGPSGPLSDASVLLANLPGQTTFETTTTTDAQGRFSFTGLVPGRMQVEAYLVGLVSSVPRELALGPGTPTEVTFQLTAGLSIRGKVVDDSGQPLAQAVLQALPRAKNEVGPGQTARSAADGTFALTGLSAGSYSVFAFQSNRSLDSPAVVEAGARDVKLVLLSGARITGRVQSASGRPVRHFTVDSEELRSATGAFTLRDVEPHTRSIILEGDFLTTTVPVTLEAGKTLDLGAITVDDGATVRGQVRTADGQPAVGADLTAARSDDPGAEDDLDSEYDARTDASGGFVLAHLARGRYRVVATSRHGVSRPVEIDTASAAPLSLTLEAGAEVRGRFTLPDGSPVQEGIVSVSVGAVTGQGAVMNGSFQVANLPPGKAEVLGIVHVSRSRRLGDTATFTLGPGESRTVNLEAAPMNIAVLQEGVAP